MPEQTLSQLAVYLARPSLLINDQESDLVNSLLIGMSMVESEGGLSSLDVRFSNWASNAQGGADFAFEDGRFITLGRTINMSVGEVGNQTEIFQGRITALEAEFTQQNPPELVVLAEDAFQRARMKRRTKVYEDMSIPDLAQMLAGEHNLSAVVEGFDNTNGTHVQMNESDLAFLRRLLWRYDGDLHVEGRELHLSPRSELQRNTVNLALNSQLRKVRLLADLSDQVNEVTVSGWNVSEGQRITGTSQGNHLGPGMGRNSSSFLRDVIENRSQHIGHLAVTTIEEAQAIAEAAYEERARRFVTVEGTTEGNPRLRVGTHVTLEGLGGRFSNTYYVVRAVHRFDITNGYETDFTAECAYLGNG